MEAGAIATVVYNNAAGSLNMNMSGYNYKNPAIMLDKAYGDMILAASRQGEDGLWSGKMVIANQVQTVQDAPRRLPSQQLFLLGCSRQSGPEAGDHRPRWQHLVHPEQWDLWQHVRYLHVCPSVTGMAAVVAQYVKEQGLNRQGGPDRPRSEPGAAAVYRCSSGGGGNVEYSPRKQGSGLANVYAAVTSPAYLLTDGKSATDGKAKVNLGDDPQRTGVYAFDFTVNNLSKEAADYAFRAKHQHHGGGDGGWGGLHVRFRLWLDAGGDLYHRRCCEIRL